MVTFKTLRLSRTRKEHSITITVKLLCLSFCLTDNHKIALTCRIMRDAHKVRHFIMKIQNMMRVEKAHDGITKAVSVSLVMQLPFRHGHATEAGMSL